MAQFQLLRCAVALGGDTGNTVVRHRGSPILLPELMILQFLHGEEFVTDVHVIGTCEMAQDEALTRLQMIYTKEVVGQVYPGARPRLPQADKTIPLCTLPIHKPGPTLPDSPDPKLKPLDQYQIANALETQDTDDMPGFDQPKPYRDKDDDPDPGIDAALLNARPSIEDVPQTRTSFRGQGRQAHPTPSHVPDVAGDRTRRTSQDRLKG